MFNQKGNLLLIYTFHCYFRLCFSVVAALDISMNDGDKLCPVCSYMSEEVNRITNLFTFFTREFQIIGEYALSNTTLRELGLTGGTAVIR